ncbi:acyl carrier protein [Stieleria neptunia]|uniref:Acyl carrier protein n=1 Tax=Stieleria neptunia TaxID=2527979 RepID=A0A518HZ11_9BACT|nr:hypothetical protein [Stieleria neptunia]QDV46082.1 acyl carrier protein [Stieleria neptunia]
MCELVFELEESFGIEIPDGPAADIVTVGDLYAFVLLATASRTRNPEACLSARVFHSLRRHLLLHSHDLPSPTARRISPSTPLLEALPRAKRREAWARMADDLLIRLPPLCRPRYVTFVGFAVSLAASITFFLMLGSSTFSTLVSVGCFVVTAAIIFFATRPLATLPDATFDTLRGLTEQVLARNVTKLADRHNAFSHRDVWTILTLILMDQLGVDRNKITPDAHLIRDLGYE